MSYTVHTLLILSSCLCAGFVLGAFWGSICFTKKAFAEAMRAD